MQTPTTQCQNASVCMKIQAYVSLIVRFIIVILLVIFTSVIC